MFKWLHRVGYAMMPALIPTPQDQLPPKPTPSAILKQRIEDVRDELLQLHLKRAEIRGQERQLEILINEYQLSLAFFGDRELT